MSKFNQNIHRCGESERLGVYRAIYERRDVRSTFTPTPIEDEVLARLLDAAPRRAFGGADAAVALHFDSGCRCASKRLRDIQAGLRSSFLNLRRRAKSIIQLFEALRHPGSAGQPVRDLRQQQ